MELTSEEREITELEGPEYTLEPVLCLPEDRRTKAIGKTDRSLLA